MGSKAGPWGAALGGIGMALPGVVDGLTDTVNSIRNPQGPQTFGDFLQGAAPEIGNMLNTGVKMAGDPLIQKGFTRGMSAYKNIKQDMMPKAKGGGGMTFNAAFNKHGGTKYNVALAQKVADKMANISSGQSGVNAKTAMMLGNPIISSTAKMSKSSVGRAYHDNETLGYSRALGAALIGGGPQSAEPTRKVPAGSTASASNSGAAGASATVSGGRGGNF